MCFLQKEKSNMVPTQIRLPILAHLTEAPRGQTVKGNVLPLLTPTSSFSKPLINKLGNYVNRGNCFCLTAPPHILDLCPITA
jgi:hypothetical protein